jgi:hypothetical protein
MILSLHFHAVGWDYLLMHRDGCDARCRACLSAFIHNARNFVVRRSLAVNRFIHEFCVSSIQSRSSMKLLSRLVSTPLNRLGARRLLATVKVGDPVPINYTKGTYALAAQ